MDDVGLPELRQARYVVTRIGDVDVEEMKLGEAHVPEDTPTLPQEMPLSEDGTGHFRLNMNSKSKFFVSSSLVFFSLKSFQIFLASAVVFSLIISPDKSQKKLIV